jgi:hypothetical protein
MREGEQEPMIIIIVVFFKSTFHRARNYSSYFRGRAIVSA